MLSRSTFGSICASLVRICKSTLAILLCGIWVAILVLRCAGQPARKCLLLVLTKAITERVQKAADGIFGRCVEVWRKPWRQSSSSTPQASQSSGQRRTHDLGYLPLDLSLESGPQNCCTKQRRCRKNSEMHARLAAQHSLTPRVGIPQLPLSALGRRSVLRSRVFKGHCPNPPGNH